MPSPRKQIQHTRSRNARKRLQLKRQAPPVVAAALTSGQQAAAAYPTDPVGYARNILGIRTLTAAQQQILQSLLEPPYKTLVPSAHDVGKTFVAAVAANWWYDSFDPGLILSTAPTQRDVVDLLWTEIRLQRQRAGLPQHFSGPRAPEMRTSEEHYAKGFTASKGESFQGRHRQRMLFIFDEANGIEPIYWESTRSMFDPSLGHAWLSIYNPTSTTTQAYAEANAQAADGRPRWHLFRLSAADHPNLRAELDGRPRPVPGAVSLAMFREWLSEWCEPVAAGDERATDFGWPPADWCAAHGQVPQVYRPGPIFQGRALGLDPDTGDGVWSLALWQACLRPGQAAFPPVAPPQIGCDCATGKGDDYHAIHGRWGAWSLHHETANTMDPVRICGRLKEVARLLATWANARRQAAPLEPQQIPIKLDDDGTGNAVGRFLAAAGYSVFLIGAGTKPADALRYPRRRDELWFQVAGQARAGNVRLLAAGTLAGVGLDRAALRRLQQQLLAPAWQLDSAGRRQVEPKDETKEKIGRSPDDADALNLAYYDAPNLVPVAVTPRGNEDEDERRGRDSPRSGPYGVRR